MRLTHPLNQRSPDPSRDKLLQERGDQPWPGAAGVGVMPSSGFGSSPKSLSVAGKVIQSPQK